MAPSSSFDQLADVYDRYRIGYAPELYEALEDYGLGARVLDVGCGTGLVTATLCDAGRDVVGVDRSEQMLARARERVPGTTFVCAPSETLPFEADSFDAATSAQAFHWFDEVKALAELMRVVRPGGTIAVWWKGLMRGDATRLLREAIARDLGLEPTPDLMARPFTAFDGADLAEKRLRVVPWHVPMRVDDYIGYERSRARARAAYGERLGDYIDRLGRRLAQGGPSLWLAYVHHLYLGRVRN